MEIKTREELFLEYNRKSSTDWKGYDKEKFVPLSEIQKIRDELKTELEKGANKTEEFDYIWVDRLIDEAFKGV